MELHATGRITEIGNPDSMRRRRPATAGLSGSEAHYARLAEFGFSFGPAFRTIESLSAILRAKPGRACVWPKRRDASRPDICFIRRYWTAAFKPPRPGT